MYKASPYQGTLIRAIKLITRDQIKSQILLDMLETFSPAARMSKFDPSQELSA